MEASTHFKKNRKRLGKVSEIQKLGDKKLKSTKNKNVKSLAEHLQSGAWEEEIPSQRQPAQPWWKDWHS